MIEEKDTVEMSWSWGDVEGNLGVSIDRHARPSSIRYTAQTWADGQPTALQHCPSFETAIAWIKRMLVDDYRRQHDLVPANEDGSDEMRDDEIAPTIVGLAPCRSADDQPWTWVVVDGGYADDWWLGSDYEDPASRPVDIAYLPAHESDA